MREKKKRKRDKNEPRERPLVTVGQLLEKKEEREKEGR